MPPERRSTRTSATIVRRRYKYTLALLEKISDQADEPHSSVYSAILFNMFSRAATTFFYASVAFGLLAAATPNPVEKRWAVPTTSHAVTTTVTVTAPGPTTTSTSNCNTGPIQCCQSTEKVRSARAIHRL